MKKPIHNLRWWIAGLVFLSTVINYIDRQTLAVLMPRLTKEFQLSNTEYSAISNAFLIPYTLMFIVAGLLIDRYGTKFIYGAAAAWWSVAAMLHSTAGSALGFGVWRFLLGVAESANFVGAQKVAAEWFPPKDRGTLNGWVQAGTVTGAVITPPAVIWIAQHWGWRTAFLFTGALGVIWVLAWIWFYQLPQQHPRISAEELRLIENRQGDDEVKAVVEQEVAPSPRWVDFLKLPQTWGLLFARIISDPVWWFYLFWLPMYLTEQQGVSEKRMSMIVWIPYLVSDIGSVAGGWYSGRLIAQKLGAVASRKVVMIASALLMPLGLFLLIRPSTAWTIVVISLVLGAHSSWKTNLVTMTVDIFPKRVVGRIHGIVAAGGGIGGVLFNTFAGYVIDQYSYLPLIIVMGFLHPIAYLCVKWLVRGEVLEMKPYDPVGRAA